MHSRVSILTLLALLGGWWGSAQALTVEAPFAADYTATSLGSVPGVPTRYGGLTFKSGESNTLLIGGSANTAAGLLYEVTVVRDADNHVVGFDGPATPFGSVGEFNDGGVTYGPGDVLFTAQWPVNNLGQTRPGSTDEDRVDNLAPLGIGGSSISALGFVPSGFSNAGAMKVVSWSAGNWYDVQFAPDGGGTFDLLSASQVDLDPIAPGVQVLPGGPEGFVYVDAASPGFGVESMLVSDFSANRVSAYEVNGSGDPIVSTRRDFITGLTGAEGAAIDPLTGDFLFSTFGGLNQVVVVQGFAFAIGEITGVKWEDLDSNGLIDAGEALLSGWTIELLDANGVVISNTVTDTLGVYSFPGLPPGDYRVREVLQAGWEQTFDAAGGSLLSLSVGQAISGVNFGNRLIGEPPPPPGVPAPGPLALIGLGAALMFSRLRAGAARSPR